MQVRSLQVLGGGPGGLYLALLLRRHDPSLEVVVHERTAPEETFGFGVGFTGATLRRLAAADPESHAAILLTAHPNPTAEFDLPSGRASLQLRGNVAIERAKLLKLLVERAEDAGVQFAWGSEPEAESLAGPGTIVAAADGVGSGTRERLGERLGARIEEGHGYYIWCATDVCLPRSVYTTAETEHGTFVAHAYPYGADRSTFLIEAGEETLSRAGLSGPDLTVGETDERSLSYLQEAFASVLGSGGLVGNKSQWRRFRTVTLERWYDGDLVLLGDAAHTAHYSVGSGTKIAMEDSIALAEALASEPDARAAFERYEVSRRAEVERLQWIARRSQAWWESFPERSHLPAEQLALAFLTRTGNVQLDDVEDYDPLVLSAAATAMGADRFDRETILTLPLRRGKRAIAGRLVGRSTGELRVACPIVKSQQSLADGSTPPYVELARPDAVAAARGRFPDSLLAAVLATDELDPVGPSGRELLASARCFVVAGCDAIRLSSFDSSRAALLVRLNLAEQIRLATGAITVTTCPARHIDDGIVALASGRTDLLALDDATVARPSAEGARDAA